MGVSRKKESGPAKAKGKGKGKRKGGGDRSAEASTSGDGFGAVPPNPEKELLNDPRSSTPGAKAPTPAVSTPVVGCEPVFALATEEVLTSARVGSLTAPPKYDTVLAALLSIDADDNAAMNLFMQANRDLLDYRFLYRLTADKLLADNLGDATRAASLQSARVRAVAFAQRFDTPLFKEVSEAEGRLGGVLARFMQGETPEAAEVTAACGTTPLAAFAFWMVTIAAIAAWEAKLPIASVADQAKAKLGELAVVRKAIEAPTAPMASASGVDLLAPLFALPNLAAAEPASGQYAAARQTLAEVAPDPADALALVRRVGCTYCQASRHGFKAYNPLVQQAAALQDVLLHGELQPLTGCDIQAPKRPISSQMVQAANQADKVLETTGTQIPLFW